MSVRKAPALLVTSGGFSFPDFIAAQTVHIFTSLYEQKAIRRFTERTVRIDYRDAIRVAKRSASRISKGSVSCPASPSSAAVRSQCWPWQSLQRPFHQRLSHRMRSEADAVGASGRLNVKRAATALTRPAEMRCVPIGYAPKRAAHGQAAKEQPIALNAQQDRVGKATATPKRARAGGPRTAAPRRKAQHAGAFRHLPKVTGLLGSSNLNAVGTETDGTAQLSGKSSIVTATIAKTANKPAVSEPIGNGMTETGGIPMATATRNTVTATIGIATTGSVTGGSETPEITAAVATTTGAGITIGAATVAMTGIVTGPLTVVSTGCPDTTHLIGDITTADSPSGFS